MTNEDREQIELENYYRQHPSELYWAELEFPPYEEWDKLPPLPDELEKKYKEITKEITNDK